MLVPGIVGSCYFVGYFVGYVVGVGVPGIVWIGYVVGNNHKWVQVLV